MSKKHHKKHTQPDGTRKRVRTEVSDSSTSDEESMTNKPNTSTDNWPRFLIIEPVSDTRQGLAGELKSVKRI